MIEVDGVTKQYGEVTAVRDLSVRIETGEVFGLVGPNGAGKTSTLKMLAGLVDPTAGRIEVNGRAPSDPQTRAELGFLPEESSLYDEMTPHSYLHFFADLYEVPRERAQARIEETLDRLDLDVRDRPVGDFSKGMMRKVAIARSLINDPSVLIYDEPASGLDPVTTNTVVNFTRELAERGKTVLFSAHDLYHVESVCDRIAIMNEGEIQAIGTLEEIRAAHGSVTYRVFTDVEVDGAKPSGEEFLSTAESMAAVESVREQATEAGGTVTDIRSQESSLEDLFLSVTGTRNQ
ncbi:MAG: ATP-binding cassette domain-containing protein [Halodesulfurarchaeum sp.]